MDQETIRAFALAAGLDKALAEFPADVAAAAAAAAANLDTIKVTTDAAVEPWPPMRAGTSA